jgi:(2Fe-2S) ferredoxin
MSECHATVCRGCCCGRKDSWEAARRLALLRSLIKQVRVSDCLGPCDRRDVVVVTPSRDMRKKGAKTVWLGWVNDEAVIELIGNWIRAGGPGRRPMPRDLDIHRFKPAPRRKTG